MSVSIKFESNLTYQADAIDSVVQLLFGWNEGTVEDGSRLPVSSNGLIKESLVSNPWGITQSRISENAKAIQRKMRVGNTGERVEIIPNALRLDEAALVADLRDFSIEMETGTGKTYVYLRTAIELYLKYKISKFVIVVPGVAIREGVLASLKLLKAHFKEVYSGLQYDSFAYESKSATRLRQFATSTHLQFLVINIQAFSKDSTIIHRENDELFDMAPIDFITAVNPVVIMDEPQRLKSKAQIEAIESLNPLFRLRYSATHIDRHCLLYRLGPVDAFELKLVKRIQVLSMSADEDRNSAYVELKKINATAGSVTATLLVNKPHKRVQITAKRNMNLREETSLSVYDGWVIEDIHAEGENGPGYVEFTNGQRVFESNNTDVDRDWWQRAQIAAAIKEHFETELRLATAVKAGAIQPTKALTLFFIDKVANYDPADSKFKRWFEELYPQIAGESRFRNLQKFNAKDVHRGYFATTKGKAKDTSGDSADDQDAYDLIMKDKERLLSQEEPVRFIFSHSALSEGWDNPNVFVICNLQESQSEMKRRQQIGRGLRLPVMANGERCRYDAVNWLTVLASETFENFARGLQTEIEKDTRESFGTSQIVDARKRVNLELNVERLESLAFKALWSQISPKTKYALNFETDDLISEAVHRFNELGRLEPISEPKIRVQRGELVISAGKEIDTGSMSVPKTFDMNVKRKMPDVLKDLSGQLAVSRSSIYRIVMESGRLPEAVLNPAEFQAQVRKAIQGALAHTLYARGGITYTQTDEYWRQQFFLDSAPAAFEGSLVNVTKSIYPAIPVDSQIERKFAEDLEKREDIELFLKLPSWFKVGTPIGNYNPDWAIVRKVENGDRDLYLVRETKGSSSLDDLFRESERWKVTFGRKHFEAIHVDYKQISDANQLDADIPDYLETAVERAWHPAQVRPDN